MTSLREKHDGLGDGRDSVRLWLRLLSCATVVEKRLKRRFAHQFDTTLPRFDVLAALDRHPGGMTMGALSRALLVSNGNVTLLVQTLVKAGWASLGDAPGDRRASVVAPTPAGRAAFGDLAAAHHDWIDGWLGRLDAADRTALYALLGKLKDSIAEDDA